VTNIIEVYKQNPTAETLAKLVEETGRSKRSIIGSLAKAGVYQRTPYLNKRGELPVTKLELVAQIEAATGLELSGLEKAPKGVLICLKSYVSQELEGATAETTDAKR